MPLDKIRNTYITEQEETKCLRIDNLCEDSGGDNGERKYCVFHLPVSGRDRDKEESENGPVKKDCERLGKEFVVDQLADEVEFHHMESDLLFLPK
jgi:hypothetical protein